MVAQTRTTPALQSLKFKDKLIGKAQSSDVLLKKVKVSFALLLTAYPSFRYSGRTLIAHRLGIAC